MTLKRLSRKGTVGRRNAFLCGFKGAVKERKLKKLHTISGDNSLRDPPVPIPNTEVKPQHADGTWLATARESRSSPDSIFLGGP